MEFINFKIKTIFLNDNLIHEISKCIRGNKIKNKRRLFVKIILETKEYLIARGNGHCCYANFKFLVNGLQNTLHLPNDVIPITKIKNLNVLNYVI